MYSESERRAFLAWADEDGWMRIFLNVDEIEREMVAAFVRGIEAMARVIRQAYAARRLEALGFEWRDGMLVHCAGDVDVWFLRHHDGLALRDDWGGTVHRFEELRDGLRAVEKRCA